MLKAMCNVSADAGEKRCDKHGSMHICSLDKYHHGVTHVCKCGAIFMSVKKSELEKPLQKIQ